MNPPATSVFDLPERLSSKADPSLIAADERHFAAIGSTLEQSITDLSIRLDAARRAPARDDRRDAVRADGAATAAAVTPSRGRR